jgi:plastocyanin
MRRTQNAMAIRMRAQAPLFRLSILALLMLLTQDVRAESVKATGIVSGSAILIHVDEDGVRTEVKGRSLKDIVVFLEPIGHEISFAVPTNRPAIVQHRARFEPNFLVVVQGQTISFPNNDRIFHNVFSYSTAKKFDLGLYKQGDTREVTFSQPGVVETFCSIHSSMYAQIYVSPTPYFAVTDTHGAFRIDTVPVGKYKLRTWNKRLPEGIESIEVTEVHVNSDRPVVVNVDLGGQ